MLSLASSQHPMGAGGGRMTMLARALGRRCNNSLYYTTPHLHLSLVLHPEAR